MNIYRRHCFPPDVISYALWLYHRFNLSHRDIEDPLAEPAISVSHESIRLWCIKIGPKFTRRLRRMHRGCGDTFYIDEVLVRIRGLDLAGAIQLICQYPVGAICNRERRGIRTTSD